MRASAAAVALGRTILIAPTVRATESLIRHELAHVRQWERHPRSFPFRYLSAHILHGYLTNPYEAEARAAETGRSTSGDST
ncbi:MAG: eCIS core domain-containing protein [Gemmatimonadota bacterium]